MPNPNAQPSSPAPDNGLVVFASGSGGNCSLLRVTLDGRPFHYLIDLGLSPRRTRAALASFGVDLAGIDGVFVTHFDSDHCHPGWCTAVEPALPSHADVFFHRSHLRRATAVGLQARRLAPFREGFRTAAGLAVRCVMSSHDSLGAAVFRIETPGGTLGFATDLGRACDTLVGHLRGVDVLAIESNYCPELELSSGRPARLIERVMGGRGHLSNHECVEAVRRIGPRDHVVLLHLSRECNDPARVRRLHEGRGYPYTISLQSEPTGWVALRRSPEAPVRLVPHTRVEQGLLFR